MVALNWCIFRKNRVDCSSAGPKILAFGSHSSVNFQPILNCFIPNFKLKYEDSESLKTDCVNAVVFNLNDFQCQPDSEASELMLNNFQILLLPGNEIKLRKNDLLL